MVVNRPRVLILRAPGTNCDLETAFAFENAGASPSLVHISELIDHEEKLEHYHILAIPGGFTYGDYLGAGRVLANELRLRLGGPLQKFIQEGRPILGICNGFQVLVKAGLLPYVNQGRPALTITSNDSGRFECRWVYLSVETTSRCIFTQGIERLYLPVAHSEGKLVLADTLSSRCIALYYTDANGNRLGYPFNPNGSELNIAGLSDPSGLIFGLMPHPERHIHPSHHPRWTRGEDSLNLAGVRIFQNAVSWVKRL